MFSIRKMLLPALTIAAFGAGWLAKTSAQPKPKGAAPLITYFSHEKVDSTFAQALGSNGSKDLFARKDSKGQTNVIHANSRGKSDEGEIHSHEGWTGVVVIMSGAATFITPGTASTNGAKTSAADKFGGQLIGGGETHRVGKGDVVIIPPGAPHAYKNIEEPFRYLVIQTPL